MRALLRHPFFALFDEPGAGKSKQVIDAACLLWEASEIDTVLVCCPAQVKISWADPDFGEIQKHSFVPSLVQELRSARAWMHDNTRLQWIIVSFEFGRKNEELVADRIRGRKVLMVADESIRISNHTADTTKVFTRLRDRYAARAVILNGTPGDVLKCYSQYRFLSPTIFGRYQNFYHYCRRFCTVLPRTKRNPFPIVKPGRNKEEFDRRTVPYTLRRYKSADIPQKIYSVLSATLTAKTWKHYVEMRRDLITWLDANPSAAAQAVVKLLRLAQLTSGFLGGVEDLEHNRIETREIGSEKMDAFIEWLEYRREANPNFRCIAWCRFRAELERLQAVLEQRGMRALLIMGGQSKTDRREAVNEFMTGTESCVLLGQPQAGGLGLNLIAAHHVVYLSNDFNFITRDQSEDRCHRRGQTQQVQYFDMLAVGPDGQKTIDHYIVKALRAKKDMQTWTAENWRKILLSD